MSKREYWVWVITSDTIMHLQPEVYLFQVKNYYQYKKLSFFSLVSIEDGYIKEAKKHQVGFILKKKRNINWIELLDLTKRAQSAFRESVINGDNPTKNLESLLSKS